MALPKSWTQDTINWIIRMVLGSLVCAGLFWFSALNNILISDVVVDISHIQLMPILFIELVDKYTDGTIFKTIQNKAKGGRAWALTIVLALGAFFVVCAAISGSLAMKAGAFSVSTVIAAGLITLYILAPETGDAELLLYVWLGATIATGFTNFAVMPYIPGIDYMILNPFK